MPEPLTHTIFPISDSALTIDFGNIIDESTNSKVLSLFRSFQMNPPEGVIEVVPAYSSLTIYYDVFQISKSIPPDQTVFEWLSWDLQERVQLPLETNDKDSRQIEIPVCYENEFAPDMEGLSARNGISVEEIIHIHCSKQYRVYMLGFLPGFSYMGEVDERISLPRKSQPKAVEAGSVGIAGRQTGIYPFSAPGGWQIIGRTPLKLFDPAKEEPTLLRAGDMVRFTSIRKNEFENY